MIRERRTAAVHAPTWLQSAAHLRQNRTVRASDVLMLIRRGRGRWDSPWVRTKEWVSPSAMVKLETVARSRPLRGVEPERAKRWRPAIAVSAPSGVRLTQGTVMP